MVAINLPTRENLKECLGAPAGVAQTALGPVELACRGQGPPLLCVHGGPGGYDQSLLLGELFRVNGFTVLAVSRPGYLGTPLSSGGSPMNQADLLAALLDTLKIDKAAVLGASAGGPASYLLAARHPERVAALVEIDAVCRSYTVTASPLEQKLFVTTAGLALTLFFTEHFPKTALRGLLQTESTLDPEALDRRVEEVLADPLKRAFFTAMVHSFADQFGRRKQGVANDLEFYADLGDLPLKTIACPTLIFHGDKDNDVPLDHAEYAASQIPGARLEHVATGSHLGFWLADEAQSAQELAVTWLRGECLAGKG